MPQVRHIPKLDCAQENDCAPGGNRAKLQMIEEVDRLTREVHTVSHQLSSITKRLFDLKQQMSKTA